jgi:ATP-dependent Clp protease ATP-binding subunit ClpC
MHARFRLILQELQDGRYTATAPAFPAFNPTAPSPSEAVEAARSQIVEHLTKSGPKVLAEYVFADRQELRTVPIEVTPAGGVPHDPIGITISLLVTTQSYSRGLRYVVTAPRISQLVFVVGDQSEIEAKAKAAVAALAKRWDARAVLNIDQPGSILLATIDVDVPDSPPVASPPAAPPNQAGTPPNVLQLCGINLTGQTTEGYSGRADRREALIERMITFLDQGPRRSVVLVGRPGVGKTTLVYEVVARILQDSVPPSLRKREVWFVTANNLIAGMKYTGEWQGRTQALIALVRKERQILYMGDPTEIVSAGRWSGSDNNMGRHLRPYIGSGEMTVICDCTVEQYEAVTRAEPSFLEAFHRIDVPETDEADTAAILLTVTRRIEEDRGLRIHPNAIATTQDLTRRFVPYRAFPGKAIHLLEDVVTSKVGEEHPDRPIRTVERSDVIAHFTRATGLPELLLSDEVTLRVAVVRAYIEARLLGQPDAVEAMVNLVSVIKAGLNDPNKPLGSYFFVGPTGVGKTEMAKVLAEFLFGSRERMLRFDMSEYAASDALPRLVGSAWRGDDEGELTRRVREQPLSVVLFDEIEKAHPGVLDALLGVLGEGRLTDTTGRTADFRNAIIIMTSNLGAGRRDVERIGFGRAPTNPALDADELHAHFVREAERFFRPEFFNRIDRIVAFRPLSMETVRLIVRRELGRLLLREGIVRRRLIVEVDDAVVDRLVQVGFHPLYGARPLQRTIEREVILPLAHLIVADTPSPGGVLRLGLHDGQILLSRIPTEGTAEIENDPAGPALAAG